MEHLPIVIFMILLSVYIALVIFAKMLIEENIKQRSEIKKLTDDIEYLEKFTHSNTERVFAYVGIEPMYFSKEGCKEAMIDRLCYNLVVKMSETFKEKMKCRIKDLIENGYMRNIFERDIYSNEIKLRVEVPIFRVDYEYIKLAELKDIFR